MLDVDEVRRIALELPEAVEKDHHGRPSFRVGEKIFATLWTPTALNVMAADDVILTAVERWDSCTEVYWGKRLSAVQVALPAADADQVEELLFAAWSRKAPRRLLAE
ncbi:MAG TPA: MmcQ/YjbR family DNA-binding protein [Baekduia sp.]|uniref:MmcQ/YjbR family DNA-binding protein n=1 Tax=Baekduia sp. TaxID=2600305 RepID=UPI002B6D18C0|nr:MmcQ/YjbR family DNA-binding protein [Baekduia sp.]HMJ37437.1 MmcQ/YjbR family DNA-binding protein [Baekduia sp.]